MACGGKYPRSIADISTTASFSFSTGSSSGSAGDLAENGRERLVRSRLRWLEGNWDGTSRPSCKGFPLTPARRRRRGIREPNREQENAPEGCCGKIELHKAMANKKASKPTANAYKYPLSREHARGRSNISTGTTTTAIGGEELNDATITACHRGAARRTNPSSDGRVRCDHALTRSVTRPIEQYVLADESTQFDMYIGPSARSVPTNASSMPGAEGKVNGRVRDEGSPSGTSTSSSEYSTSALNHLGSDLQDLGMIHNGGTAPAPSAVCQVGSRASETRVQHPNLKFEIKNVHHVISPRRKAPATATAPAPAPAPADGISHPTRREQDEDLENLKPSLTLLSPKDPRLVLKFDGDRYDGHETTMGEAKVTWQISGSACVARARQRVRRHLRVLQDEVVLASVRHGERTEATACNAATAAGTKPAKGVGEEQQQAQSLRDVTRAASTTSHSTSWLSSEEALLIASSDDELLLERDRHTSSGAILPPLPPARSQYPNELANHVTNNETAAGEETATEPAASTAAYRAASSPLDRERSAATQRADRLTVEVGALKQELELAAIRQAAADATAAAVLDRARAAELSRDVKEIQIRNLEVRLARMTDELTLREETWSDTMAKWERERLSTFSPLKGPACTEKEACQSTPASGDNDDRPHGALIRRSRTPGPNAGGMLKPLCSTRRCGDGSAEDADTSGDNSAIETKVAWGARFKKLEGQLRHGFEGIGARAFRANAGQATERAIAGEAKRAAQTSGTRVANSESRAVESATGEKEKRARRPVASLAASGSLQRSAIATDGELEEFWGSDYCTSA